MTKLNRCSRAFLMPDQVTYYCRDKRVWFHESKERFRSYDQCKACLVQHQKEKPELILPEPELNPGILQKMKNFFGAATKQITTGFDASPEVKELRKTICKSCPLWEKKEGYCTDRRCGCKASQLAGGMETKWGWSSSACPKSYWSAQLKKDSYDDYLKRCKDPFTGERFQV